MIRSKGNWGDCTKWTYFRFFPFLVASVISSRLLVAPYVSAKQPRTQVTSSTDSFQLAKDTPSASTPNLALHHTSATNIKNTPLAPGFRRGVQSILLSFDNAPSVPCLREPGWIFDHHTLQLSPKSSASPLQKWSHPKPDVFRPVLNQSLSSTGLDSADRRLSWEGNPAALSKRRNWSTQMSHPASHLSAFFNTASNVVLAEKGTSESCKLDVEE